MQKAVGMAYEAPIIEIVCVVVECGFATSNVISGWADGGSYEGSFDI